MNAAGAFTGCASGGNLPKVLLTVRPTATFTSAGRYTGGGPEFGFFWIAGKAVGCGTRGTDTLTADGRAFITNLSGGRPLPDMESPPQFQQDSSTIRIDVRGIW